MVYRHRLLDLPKLAQAGVAVAADNDMVVQYHAERGGGLLDILGHGDVGLGWGRIARRMIVHQDQRRGAELERALDDLARIDRRMVDGSALLAFILDQYILAIEEQDVELLDLAVRDLGAAVIDKLVPGVDDWPLL